MLEMRTNCEACSKELAPNESDAFICSYECTFCSDCAANDLKLTCPNCGGNLVLRPSRS